MLKAFLCVLLVLIPPAIDKPTLDKAPPQQVSLDGWYEMEGLTASGKSYGGMVLIILREDDATFHVHWLYNDGGRSTAVGSREGNTLATAAMVSNLPLVCNYQISQAGGKLTLTGNYRHFNGSSGEEKLTFWRSQKQVEKKE